MSDRNSPSPGAPARHPEEALAGFVDGTLSEDERRLVEAHLRTCSACRAEVDLAKASLEATGALPEADAPGLDPEAIVHTARTVVPLKSRSTATGERQRPARWLGVVGGLAAAAIAGVFLVGLFRGQGGGGSATTAAQAPGVESTARPPTGGSFAPLPSPGAVQPRTQTAVVADENFSRASVAELAKSLVNGGTSDVLSQQNGARRLSATELGRARLCAQGAAGTADSPLLVVRARFEGRPAYLTAFMAEGSKVARVVVTPVGTCTVLYQTQYPGTGPSPG